MQHVTRTYAHRAPFGGTLSQTRANGNSNHSDNRSSSHSGKHRTLLQNPKPRKSGVDRSANARAIVLGHPRAKAHFSRIDGRTHIGVWLVGPHQASSQLKRNPANGRMRGLLRPAALPDIAAQPNVCRNSQGLASRGLPSASLLASHRQRAKNPGRKRVGNACNAASCLRPLSTRVLERNRHVHPNVFPAHPARNLRRHPALRCARPDACRPPA